MRVQNKILLEKLYKTCKAGIFGLRTILMSACIIVQQDQLAVFCFDDEVRMCAVYVFSATSAYISMDFVRIRMRRSF